MAKLERRTWIVAAVLIVGFLLIGVGIWRKQQSNEANANSGPEVAAEPVDRQEAVRRKQAAHAETKVVERVAIGGRVTRADDGTGIAGAVVLLSRKGLVQGQAPKPGEPTALLRAVTDANGGWELSSVGPGRYMLSATAEGFLPATNNDVRVTGKQSLDLRLQPGGALLRGTVTDIGGGPIEGVLVRVDGTEQVNLGFSRAPLAALTDEDGEYRLQVATGSYSVSTYHADYVTDARLTAIPEGGRREDFRLVPGGAIEGVVLARPEGKPVAGARVTFTDSRNEGFGGETNISIDGSVVVTDDEGRFRLTGLRAGVVALTARAAAHASLTPEEVAIGIGEQVSDVELWVDAAYTISGFVVPKGDPEGAIEGVLVGAWQMQPFGLLVANEPTTSEGYFEIVGVPPGQWQVGAVGEEHLLTLSGAAANVVDRNVTDLLVELDNGIYIRGRVDPGVRARVRVELKPENMSITNLGSTIADAIANAETDETGAFSLGPLHPGGGFGGTRELELVARSDEGFRGSVTVELRREDLDGVVVSMTKGASVSGMVLDENGVPQHGVTVSITAADPKSGAGGFPIGGGSDRGSPTDEHGKFAARGLELGKHHVVVKDAKNRPMNWARTGAAGPAPAPGKSGSVPPIELDITDTVNEQLLDLRVVPRDAEITGVVLDADGLPVADAWVRASLDMDLRQMWGGPADDEPERVEGVVPKDKDDARVSKVGRSAYFSEPPVLTDENGMFVLKDLRRDGSYHLVAEAERGGARATLDEVAAGSRVTLNLEQLGGLDGVVTLDGKPVTDYTIEARGPNTRDKRVVHPEGRFRLDRLDPGSYTLAVTADAGTGTAEVELPQAGRVEVKIVLERAGVLRGKVIGDKDGEPLAGLRIMVMSDSVSDTSAGVGLLTGQGPKTDKHGRFEITGVSPGTGTLTFLDPDVQFSSGSTDVAVVEYRLEPGATEDLGTIRGLQGDTVPADERGTLQMALRQAPWAKRPRPPGTDLDAERPDDQADDPTMRLWVYSVDLGGVAEQAGVVPGDEIITIDGRSVAELGAPMAASSLSAARVRVGQEVALELLRGDKRVDLRLEAAPRQP